MNTFIYTIADENNNIRYVGKSNNPFIRIKRHLTEGKGTHKYNWLNSIIKRGFYPIVEILDEIPLDSWEIYEIYWISQFKAWGFDLINQSLGGMGPTGIKRSDNFKEKIRIRQFGSKLSESHKKNISNALILKYQDENYFTSRYDKKYILDKDVLYQKYIIENLSIPKISKELGISEKTIFSNLKQFNIIKDKTIWKQQCASHDRKHIIQYDLQGNIIDTYIGLVDVENRFGKKTNISNCCLGRAKTAYGFIWRYDDNQFDLGLDKLDRNTLRIVDQYSLDGDYINTFKSIKSASNATSVNDGSIQSCCSGRYKSAGGFIWKYK